MNEQEAMQVLVLIGSPFNREITPDLFTAWWGVCLRDCEYDEALSVAGAMLAGSQFMPVPATFVKTRTDMILAARREAVPALPAPEPRPDVARSAISDMRSALGASVERGARGHWHGGPDPCPVCGGLRPGAS